MQQQQQESHETVLDLLGYATGKKKYQGSQLFLMDLKEIHQVGCNSLPISPRA